MPVPFSHFAIHADDCERALEFYREVFGWRFEAWGPPGFWRIHLGQPGIEGALHARQEPLSGTGVRGFVCSFAVEDLEKTLAAISAHGGKVLMPGFHIEQVGTVARFEDTEGNVADVMQYLPGVRESMGTE